MKKRVACMILAALTLLALLAACQQTPADGGSQTGSPNTSNSTGTAGGEVTITYATFHAEDEEIFAELIRKFESENPGIKVKFDTNPDTNAYYTSLKANLQSKSGPDVFDCHPMFDFVVFVNEGMAVDMTDMEFTGRYNESAKALTSVGGRVYGYSQAVNLICMLYDKDVFSEKGYEIPGDWDAYLALSDKLKTDGYSGTMYCGATVRSNWLQGALFNEVMGPDAYKELLEAIDRGDVTDVTQNEDFMLALKTLSEYNQKKLLHENSFNIDFTQSISYFAQKKTPVLTMGTWLFGSKDTDIPGIDAGIFPIPTIKGADVAYAESAQISMINSASPNIEAAKKWVEFLATPENAGIYVNATKMTPTIKGVEADFEEAAMLSEQMDKGVAILPIIERTKFEHYTDNWTAMLEDILINGKDYEAAAREFSDYLGGLDLKNVT